MPYSSRQAHVPEANLKNNKSVTNVTKQYDKPVAAAVPSSRGCSKPIIQDIKLVRPPSRPHSRPQG